MITFTIHVLILVPVSFALVKERRIAPRHTARIAVVITFLQRPEQSEQALPCNPSMPSFPMMGTIIRAAAGSAHHRPKKKLRINPASRMADRYVQNSVCLASACIAAPPSAFPTFRLALERMGITTKETQARTIPGMLCSGAPTGPQVQHRFIRDVGRQ
jgi:hypothetical protein